VVPPVADTVQLNAFPTVTPAVGHVTVTASGCGATLTVVDAEALTLLASVTANVSVLVPLVASVREIVPVPVYGVVPPVAETVQLNALPAVIPEVGQDTVTTKG
jgi:hypothetical protein